MNTIQLGQSDLSVTPACWGLMTFGEHLSEPAGGIMRDRSLARGVLRLQGKACARTQASSTRFGAGS
jgi:aryl-alcohol dehydrogenase-like predicted oxidoreductase